VAGCTGWNCAATRWVGRAPGWWRLERGTEVSNFRIISSSDRVAQATRSTRNNSMPEERSGLPNLGSLVMETELIYGCLRPRRVVVAYESKARESPSATPGAIRVAHGRIRQGGSTRTPARAECQQDSRCRAGPSAGHSRFVVGRARSLINIAASTRIRLAKFSIPEGVPSLSEDFKSSAEPRIQINSSTFISAVPGRNPHPGTFLSRSTSC